MDWFKKTVDELANVKLEEKKHKNMFPKPSSFQIGKTILYFKKNNEWHIATKDNPELFVQWAEFVFPALSEFKAYRNSMLTSQKYRDDFFDVMTSDVVNYKLFLLHSIMSKNK
jgi:hypothetical protein